MSDNIFKEIYAKVISLFKQTEKADETRDIAKNRLRVVLMQDRTNLTPELLERMRKELIELLSKYVEMDKEALELNLDQEGDQVALMLSIPVIRAKDEAEIEKAIAEEEAKEENSEEEGEEAEGDSDEEHSEDEPSEEEPAEEENEETSETETDSQQEEQIQENNEATEDSTEENSEEEIKESSEKKEKKNK